MSDLRSSSPDFSTESISPAVGQDHSEPELLTRGQAIGKLIGIGLAGLITPSVFLAACGVTSRQPSPNRSATPNSSPEPLHPNLSYSPDNITQHLGDLEHRAGRQLFSGQMRFFDEPATDSADRDEAGWEIAALEDSKTFQLRPVVILEPTQDINWSRFDPQIPARYFKAMRDAGLPDPLSTDRRAPLWVFCPEPIVGGWSGANPSTYVSIVNAHLRGMHEVFANAAASVLIDTGSREAGTIVPAIERSNEPLLVDQIESVGIQAFSNDVAIRFDAQGTADISGFFSPDVIQRVASAFPGKPVWFNIGIPRVDRGAGVQYNVDQRHAIAMAIVNVISQVQKAGIKVRFLNIFAEDKIDVEGHDFSFPGSEIDVLAVFADQLRQLGVPLFGFAAAANS